MNTSVIDWFSLVIAILLTMYMCCVCCVSRSVVSDSLWPHGLGPARLLHPWDSPGKNTGVGCHALFQGIFPTQESNQILHCRQILYQLSYQEVFPSGSDGKESACNARDLCSIPGSGRSSGEENGKPLHYSWPGKSYGRRSLVGSNPWGHKESDLTEQLTNSLPGKPNNVYNEYYISYYILYITNINWAFSVWYCILLTILWSDYHYNYFAEEETEVQKG